MNKLQIIFIFSFFVSRSGSAQIFMQIWNKNSWQKFATNWHATPQNPIKLASYVPISMAIILLVASVETKNFIMK